MQLIKSHLQLLKIVALPLFLVLMLSTLTDQYLNAQLALSMRGDTDGPSIWFVALGAIAASLTFPLVSTLVCLYGILKLQNSKETLNDFTLRVFESSLIESLRSWGSILRWGLLFILPAFYKVLQYIFIPYIVCASRKYESGAVDALKKSKDLLKKSFFSVLFLVFLFQIFIPLLMTDLLDSWRTYSENFFKASACTLIDTLLASLFSLLLFKLFQKQMKEQQDELIL